MLNLFFIFYFFKSLGVNELTPLFVVCESGKEPVDCKVLLDWTCVTIPSWIKILTPSMPQPVKFTGWKLHGHSCRQSISRSFNTSTFNAKRFYENPFTCRCEKENKKGLRVKILHFYWSFSSDILAVKGLIVCLVWDAVFVTRADYRAYSNEAFGWWLIHACDW